MDAKIAHMDQGHLPLHLYQKCCAYVCSCTATDHHFGTLAIFDIQSQITSLRLFRVMTVVDFHSQTGEIQQTFGIQMNNLKGFFDML